MKNSIIYNKIAENEIEINLFNSFDRYQVVKKCWRKVDSVWKLLDIAFIEDWNDEDFAYLVRCLKKTVRTGGTLLGAFDENRLVGFASLENDFFGSENQYLELSSIHVSADYRGCGIGKTLFVKIVEAAERRGAKKLYISAHSSEESQLFYKKMNCAEALEYNQKAVEKEPCDCQLEYVI